MRICAGIVQSAVDYSTRQVGKILLISSACCILSNPQHALSVVELSLILITDFTTFNVPWVKSLVNPQHSLMWICCRSVARSMAEYFHHIWTYRTLRVSSHAADFYTADLWRICNKNHIGNMWILLWIIPLRH